MEYNDEAIEVAALRVGEEDIARAKGKRHVCVFRSPGQTNVIAQDTGHTPPYIFLAPRSSLLPEHRNAEYPNKNPFYVSGFATKWRTDASLVRTGQKSEQRVPLGPLATPGKRDATRKLARAGQRK